jgi:hypothetical protein
MAMYAKACTEIISACGLMTLHTIEYYVCWETLTLVKAIKIKKNTSNGNTHNHNKTIRPCILEIRILPKICYVA